MQFFEPRSRIIFLALTWRDEIEIIIWPFSYFETRTRLHIVILVFRDEIETLKNHFSWSSEKKWSWLSSRIPGIENSRWPLFQGIYHTIQRALRKHAGTESIFATNELKNSQVWGRPQPSWRGCKGLWTASACLIVSSPISNTLSVPQSFSKYSNTIGLNKQIKTKNRSCDSRNLNLSPLCTMETGVGHVPQLWTKKVLSHLCWKLNLNFLTEGWDICFRWQRHTQEFSTQPHSTSLAC